MKTRRAMRVPYVDWDQVPLLMSAEEVAKLLRVSLKTAQTYLQHGVIPGVKFDGKWFVPKEKFKAVVEGDAA